MHLLFALLVAANPSALWHIVHDKCVVDAATEKQCVTVQRNDVVLKDKRGATHFLLVPTARIAGIEAPELLLPGATNFWADAWAARTDVAQSLGHELKREQYALGINAPAYRSQDQLHIHIDCVAPGVQEALREVKGDRFAPVEIFGNAYRALFLRSVDLAGVNPFRVLASQVAPGEDLAQHSLMLIGAPSGFYLVDSRKGGEALLDRKCEIGRQ